MTLKSAERLRGLKIAHLKMVACWTPKRIWIVKISWAKQMTAAVTINWVMMIPAATINWAMRMIQVIRWHLMIRILDSPANYVRNFPLTELEKALKTRALLEAPLHAFPSLE